MVDARTALTLALLLAAAGRAQTSRYDVGIRFKAFEAAFAAHLDDDATRARCLPHLKEAVTAFFRLDLPAVARAIDSATLAARSPDAAPPGERFAASLDLRLERRLGDRHGRLGVVLDVCYDTDFERPRQELSLRLTLGGGRTPLLATIGELPWRGELSLDDVAEGDHLLHVEIADAGGVLLQRQQMLSVVENLDARLRRLRAIEAALEPKTTERATLRAWVRWCVALTRSRPLETDHPGARLLADAEAMVAIIDAGGQRFDLAHSGDERLQVVTRSGVVPARLLLPDGMDAAEPRPLVVALHGAGGSENLFFEGYGAGAAVAAARQRGWLLVAPRGGGPGQVDDLVDALAERYPIDRRRVFLLGHSMGGGQAVAAACRAPQRFAAAAVLGGGGRVKPSPELAAVRFFVAAGSDDFGLAAATNLRDALRQGGSSPVFRIYPRIEHLAIVQVALDDVFAFFDAAVAGERSGDRK